MWNLWRRFERWNIRPVYVAGWAIVVIAMLVLAVREWSSYTVGYFLDDAMYIVLAESFLYAPRYGYYFLPEGYQVAQLPFVLPLLLAPLVAMFPQQWDVLRVAPLAASVFSVSILFWGWNYLGRGLSYRWGLALVALFGLSPLTILYARALLSEAPFLAWLLLTILLAERMTQKPSRGAAIVLGIVAVGMVYTRTVGWIMLGALACYLVWRLREKALSMLAVMAVTMGLLLALVVALTNVTAEDLLPLRYAETVLDQVGIESRVEIDPTAVVNPARPFYMMPIENFLFHLRLVDWLPSQLEYQLGNFFARTGLGPLQYVPGILLLTLLMYGYWRWIRKHGVSAFNIVAPPYLFALLFWAWEGSRFFYPALPQMMFAVMFGGYGILETGAARVTRTVSAKWTRVFAVGALALLLVASVWMDWRVNAWFVPREMDGAVNAWIEQETARDAVIMTSRPVVFFVYVRRPYVRRNPRARSVAQLAAEIEKFRAEYVIAPMLNNPKKNLVDTRTSPEKRYAELTAELAARGVLAERFARVEADVSIFQVDAAKLALELE